MNDGNTTPKASRDMDSEALKRLYDILKKRDEDKKEAKKAASKKNNKGDL